MWTKFPDTNRSLERTVISMKEGSKHVNILIKSVGLCFIIAKSFEKLLFSETSIIQSIIVKQTAEKI